MNEIATAYEQSGLLQKLADDLGYAAVAESLGIGEAVLGLVIEGQAEMDDDVAQNFELMCRALDYAVSSADPDLFGISFRGQSPRTIPETQAALDLAPPPHRD